MKKNFFKKLSFVLALAMIVSVIAPAAGAFAASKPKLNATTKYLFLGQDGKEEYDFNIANKKTGWKYAWDSSNESVAVVNGKNGLVTAKKIGTTKVSVVISDKDGEEVADLTATVIVKDNIKSLAIVAPTAKTFSTNTDYDFNRTYVTDSGSKKATTSVTRWSVDKATATISDAGVFKATESGKYVVTARAFQSKAKYADWLALNDTAAKTNVLATATYEVTVAASMVKAEQVDLDTFKVTFDSAVTDAATKLTAAYLVNTTEVTGAIKKVTMSADNKVATVDMYVKFAEGKTYVVKYPDMASVQFVSATTEVADVKSVKINTTQVELNELENLDIALLNANGVDLSGDVDLLSRVTLESSNGAAYLTATSTAKQMQMYTEGATATLTATYHTYTYDSTTGAETGVLTATGTITCVKQIADPTTIAAYTIAKTTDGPNNYSSVSHSIAVDDNAYSLFVKLTIDPNDADEYTVSSHNTTVGNSTGFEFSTSDNSVLIVGTDGTLYPVKAGSAYVIVEYKDAVVSTVAVSVGAKRTVSNVTLSTNSFALSNAAIGDNKTISVYVKDQFNSTLDASKYSVGIERTTTANGTTGSNLDATSVQAAAGTSQNQQYNFNAQGTKEGTNVYKVTVTDNATNAKMYSYVTVTVDAPASASVSYWRVETDSTSYDMHLGQNDGDTTANVKVALFGYASDGTRTVRYNITDTTTAPQYLEVVTPSASTNAWDKTTTFADSATEGTLSLVTGAAAIAKAPTGTYVVKAWSGSTVLATTTFTVTDSTDVPSVTLDKSFVDLAGTDVSYLDQAVQECFTINFNGAPVEAIALTSADYTGSATTSGQYFIKYIHYHEILKDANGDDTLMYVDHKVAVNQTITIQ